MSRPHGGGRRWRSEAVPLRVLGSTGALMALGLGGCSSATYHRNTYTSAANCAADYSPVQCTSRPGAGAASVYLGPVYRMVGGVPSSCTSSDPGGGRMASLRTGSELVQRAGFGSSCRSRNRSRSWWSGG